RPLGVRPQRPPAPGRRRGARARRRGALGTEPGRRARGGDRGPAPAPPRATPDSPRGGPSPWATAPARLRGRARPRRDPGVPPPRTALRLAPARVVVVDRPGRDLGRLALRHRLLAHELGHRRLHPLPEEAIEHVARLPHVDDPPTAAA